MKFIKTNECTKKTHENHDRLRIPYEINENYKNQTVPLENY